MLGDYKRDPIYLYPTVISNSNVTNNITLQFRHFVSLSLIITLITYSFYQTS